MRDTIAMLEEIERQLIALENGEEPIGEDINSLIEKMGGNLKITPGNNAVHVCYYLILLSLRSTPPSLPI